MPINISAANRAAVAASSLMDQQIMKTQNNLSTGNRVNSAGDDPVAFFRSQDLMNRATSLKAITGNIDVGLANIKTADTAITQMKDMLKKLQETVSAARGAPASAPATLISTTGSRTFQANPTTALRIGNALAAAGEVVATGQSVATVARNKLIFDDNAAVANAATATYQGNLGLAIPAGATAANARVGITIDIGGTSVSTEMSAAVDGRAPTVGGLVDKLNAAIQAQVSANSSSKLAGASVSVDNEGKLRVEAPVTGADTVKIGIGTAAPAAAMTYSSAPLLANFGMIALPANPAGNDYFTNGFGVNATQGGIYDASLVGGGADSFQVGDTFSIALTDRAGNTVRSFFTVVSQSEMKNPAPENGSAAAPMRVSSMGDLVDAINARFNNAAGMRLTASTVLTAATPTSGAGFRLKLDLGDANTALAIEQTVNTDTNYSDVSTVGLVTNRKISANNLVSIFGAPPASTNGPGSSVRLGAPVVTVDPSAAGRTFNTVTEFSTLNWSMPTIPGTTDSKRIAAQDAYSNMTKLFDEVFNNAKLMTAGQPNLLNGDEMRVFLGTDTSKFYSVISNKVDRATLQLGNTASFATDADVETQTTRITAAIDSLVVAQSRLSVNTVSLSGYNSFMKELTTQNQTLGDDLIRADMNEESNKLKALQTMQQINQAVMSINNSLEQGVTRLLY